MTGVDVFYVELLQRFLNHELSPVEFQAAFFSRFQGEPSEMEESLFLLLDELFGDVDCYTDDPVLLAKAPDFYLNDHGLERKAKDILARLQARKMQKQAVLAKH